MMRVIKRLKTILQIVAFIIFCLQIMLAIQKYNAAPTMVSESSKTVTTLDKPMLVIICQMSQFDYARSLLLGYQSSGPFLRGEQINKTILSWTGTRNMTFNETLNYLYPSEIEKGNIYAGFRDTYTSFILPYGLCTVAEGKLSKLLSNDPKRFTVFLKKAGKYSVFITDMAAALRFQFHRPLTTGDSISIEILANSTLRKRLHYIVELTEREVNTHDGSCTNYPDQAGYTSYKHCVAEENRRRILPILGCMVPWMSDENQCIGVLKRLPKHDDMLEWIKILYRYTYSGDYFPFSSCPLPCNLVSAHAVFLQESEDELNGHHMITINFKKTVKVETVILAYNWDSLLVEIGSSLGLWLGLSVVGTFDILILGICRIKTALEIWLSQRTLHTSSVADSENFAPDPA